MERHRKYPDESHPITVTPAAQRVRVYAGDTLVANSTAALTLQESTYPPVAYVPRADVVEEVLSGTETSTYCPFKGDASYWSVTTADGTVVDAAWSYQEPYEAVAPVVGHLAWYPDRVRVVLGDDA